MRSHERPPCLDPLSGTNICETHQPTSINHLPVEILANIFLFCSQGLANRFDSPARPRRWQAPLLLCEICHHWREIALSLPLLWRSLSSAGPFFPHSALIELWFTRSRGLPLSLYLAPPSPAHDKPRYHSHAAKMFELFSNEIHRWRTVSFLLNNNLARQFSASIEGSKALKLEELDLVFDGTATKEAVAEASSLLSSFPNLRKLSWYGDILTTSLHNIPFHQLTHFYMNLCSAEKEVVECLSQCASAVEFYWKNVICTDSGSTSVYELPQTTLIHLRSLFLLGKGDLGLILCRFTLPSLVDLDMNTRFLPSTPDHSLLEDFFDRSSCPLEKFTFFAGAIDQEGISNYLIIPFLKSIPSILIFFSHAEDLLEQVLDLKDSRYLPTFDRLKLTYPSDACAAFSWK